MRVLLAAALAVACATAAQAGDARRGAYLAVLGDCAGCHTKPNGPAFAGGLPFHAQFGTVYSTNITPDRQTGIGAWAEDDFYRALHDGIAPGGRHLYPALPYIYFWRITRQDTDDLFAYLKSVKPVSQGPTPNKLMFPVNLRFGLLFWNALFFHKTPPAIPANASAQWKRGEYLVNGLGHCGGCHTPKNVLFGDKAGQELTGGTVDNWYAANLTGSKRDGLGSWHRDDVVRFLATGRNHYATAAGSMQEKVTSSTSHMQDNDLAAIAVYLKSLPAKPAPVPASPEPKQMKAGAAVFAENCVACHGEPAKPGALPDYPHLGGDTLVLGHDPSTVIRIILEGAQSAQTPRETPTFSMPAFATLSDQKIADVATYLRNSWGNRAPAVSRKDVKQLRAALR